MDDLIGKIQQASIALPVGMTLNDLLKRAGLNPCETMDEARKDGRSRLPFETVLVNVSALYVEPIASESSATAPVTETPALTPTGEWKARYSRMDRPTLLSEQRQLRADYEVQGPKVELVERLEFIHELLSEPAPETTRDAAEMEVHPA